MPTTTAEGSFTLEDGTKIYTQTWKAEEQPPKAHAFFLHGFSDHCNAYYNFFPTLASKGIEVFSFDQRGWGRSCENKINRGNTGTNAQLLSDIDTLLKPRLMLAQSTNTPLFLLGHSNGGGIALYYSIYGTYSNQLAGVVAQSPLISLAPLVKPTGLFVAAGKLAAKVLPNLQLVQKLDPKAMSRDPEVCRKFMEDELCHDTGTLLQLAEMLGRGKSLGEKETYRKLRETLPVLVLHGTGDKVTDCAVSRQWVKDITVKDKKFIEYDGWYHKLHAEPGEDAITFASDVCHWILEHATGAKAENTPAPSATTSAPAPEPAKL